MANKIALVTGGSRGLGKEMALALADKKIDVVLTYKASKDEAEKVVKEIEKKGQKAAAVSFDLSQIKSIDPFITDFKNVLWTNWSTDRFDFLINNAGMGGSIMIPQVTEEIFDNFLNVHFKGVYFLTQKLINSINDNGSVINISTGTTRFVNPGYSVYSSMKAAVEMFTKHVARDFGSRGIRANIVAPGPIETDFNNALIRNNPQIKERLAGLSPLGRVGQADDVGTVVAFLCTDESRWINGQRIEVSGGINL